MFKFIVLICLVFLVVSNEAAFKIGKKTCSPDKLVPGPEFNAVKEVNADDKIVIINEIDDLIFCFKGFRDS